MQRSDTNFARAQAEHRQLLHTLKSTVETLFLNSNCITANDTIAHNEPLLRRLHTSIEKIFIHGFRLFKQDVSKILSVRSRFTVIFSFHPHSTRPTYGVSSKDSIGLIR